jgi:hypothetical protein
MMNCAPDIAKSSPLLAVRPPDLVTRLPRRRGASTFLDISVSAFPLCISATPVALDRYLAAFPAMSRVPRAPFSFLKPPQLLNHAALRQFCCCAAIY